MILTFIMSVGIIVTQIYWVQRAYALQESEFNVKVNKALMQVAQEIMKLKEVQIPNYSPVEKINPSYYIVQTNVFIEQNVLQHFLESALTSQNLITDFQYGLYDCMSDKVNYQHMARMLGGDREHKELIKFPYIKRENYYFGVYFPFRQQLLMSQMQIWLFSSVMLVGVIAFLGYLLFIILRQKRLSEVQKDFVNNMTHELKTPLASIQMSATVLKDKSILNDTQRLDNYTNIILKESTHLTAQVDRVLQMMQSEKSKLIIKNEPIVWQEILHTAKETFDNLVEKHHGSIIINAPQESIVGSGDKLHLINTIRTLIDNAIKYCEDSPTIKIDLYKDTKHVYIKIEDNGIGIDKKYYHLIFQKFYRIPTGNVHNVKGFGLGLNYVMSIIKSHNAHIDIESKLKKGTIFTLTFALKN